MNNEFNNECTNSISNQSPANIAIRIASKEELNSAYMPYIKNGGLFIATTQQYQLGDNLSINLSLLDDVTSYTLNTTVVWINPSCAQEGLPQGIGMQFMGEEAQRVQTKIETYLAGVSATKARTDTM